MFKIGEFSRLTQVSVRMLRHYDERGLLKPAQVDAFTDYRYYSAEQLPRLNRILALQDLGFTLAQIKDMLDRPVTAPQLRGMLMLKRAEVEQQIEQEQERLTRLEARLSLIETEADMSKIDVVLKPVAPVRVALVSDDVPNYENLSPVFQRLGGELMSYLAQFNPPTRAGIALYYDDGSKPKNHIALGIELDDKAQVPEGERVKVETLPEVKTMACVVHHGSYATLPASYQAIAKWIEANGYRSAGTSREVMLAQDHDDPNKNVTEIQFPVVKA